jgi:chitodextrinase
MVIAMLLMQGCTASTNSSTPNDPPGGDTTAPTAPGALTATAASGTQLNLSWTASTDNVGVTGYKVERCTGNGCTSFAQIAGVTATSFSDSGLLGGTTYGYRVRATDAAGNLSTYSNTSYGVTTGTADTQAPSAPSGLTATASSSSQIGLTWTASTDNVGVTGYRIERCSGASCTSFAQVGTTSGASATTYTSSGLTASTSYRFRVRATDAAGNLSGYSNIVSTTTSSSADTTPPSAPANLAATASSSSQIGLSWTASTDNVGVTGYRIERCSGASCTSFAQIGTTTGATNFSNSGLTASTTYRYRVRANDAAGNLSGYSNIASATTSAGGGGSSITVSVSPKRGGLTTSQTLSITPTLTNDTGNQGVTWSFNSTGSTAGGGFSPTSSTSGNAVTFTAPSAAGVVTITATAVGDNTKTATATIGVTDLAGMLTYHNNLSRDGTNQKEYALTTSNVATGTFGKLFSCTADGALYAQPLWIPKLSIGGGTHNVIIAASMRDTVYAFDADKSPCTTYWSKTLIPSGETYGNYNDLGSADIYPDIGILGTPVIDPASKTVYLVSKTKDGGGLYHQRLHALSLIDGSEKFGGPVDLTASITVAGTGDTGDSTASCSSSSGQVPFCPLRENQRPALALRNGVVYVSWGSHGDTGNYH